MKTKVDSQRALMRVIAARKYNLPKVIQDDLLQTAIDVLVSEEKITDTVQLVPPGHLATEETPAGARPAPF
jgi:hypothetical protein